MKARAPSLNRRVVQALRVAAARSGLACPVPGVTPPRTTSCWHIPTPEELKPQIHSLPKLRKVTFTTERSLGRTLLFWFQ